MIITWCFIIRLVSSLLFSSLNCSPFILTCTRLFLPALLPRLSFPFLSFLSYLCLPIITRLLSSPLFFYSLLSSFLFVSPLISSSLLLFLPLSSYFFLSPLLSSSLLCLIHFRLERQQLENKDVEARADLLGRTVSRKREDMMIGNTFLFIQFPIHSILFLCNGP